MMLSGLSVPKEYSDHPYSTTKKGLALIPLAVESLNKWKKEESPILEVLLVSPYIHGPPPPPIETDDNSDDDDEACEEESEDEDELMGYDESVDEIFFVGQDDPGGYASGVTKSHKSQPREYQQHATIGDNPRQHFQQESLCRESPPAFYGSNIKNTTEESGSLRRSKDIRKSQLPNLSGRESQVDLRQELARKESPTSIYLDDSEEDHAEEEVDMLRSYNDTRKFRLPTLEYRVLKKVRF